MDCGGGGTSGGCRLLQVLFSVLTCRFVQNGVCIILNIYFLYTKCMRGLTITRTAKKHTTSNPLSISARLMYNPDAMKCLTPPALQRTRLLVEVNEWTG